MAGTDGGPWRGPDAAEWTERIMGEHVMPDRASGVSETELREALQAILDKVQVIAGSALASIPAEAQRADAVTGLDVERIEAVLRAHEWRSGTFSCSCGLVFATGHIRHVSALIARLVPARDDTSVDYLAGKDRSMDEHSDSRSDSPDCCDCPECGEWRDSPTADCAACGFAPARDDTSGPLPGGNG